MSSVTRCWVNGVSVDQVSVSNRGLAYADGVFETILVKDGIPQLWSRHCQRLRLGCDRLHLLTPALDWVLEKLAAVSEGLAVLKLLVYRAGTASGYASTSDDAELVALLTPYRAHKLEALAIDLGQHQLPKDPILAGIKHLARTHQVLAAQEAKRRRLDELVLCNPDGNIVEAISSNLFLRIDAQWFTPALNSAGVAGVMRDHLLEEAFPMLGVDCKVAVLPASALDQCSAAFLSNSIRGAVPVSILQGRPLEIDPIVKALNRESTQ